MEPFGGPATQDRSPSPLAAALDVVAGLFARFVHVRPPERKALALWTAHTHAIEAAEATPYIAVTSAEKGCGKSRVLEVAELLVARPLLTANTSPAALFRVIDEDRATVLMDEADTVFGSGRRGPTERGEELRGLLNAGYRRGGVAVRMQGQGAGMRPVRFDVFSPKMFAGIGRLPDTIADRSIPIRMERARRGEVERLRRRRFAPEAEEARGALALAVEQLLDELRDAEPELPDFLDDRAADCWEPLLAIADAAGGSWPRSARSAALALSGARERDESLRTQLLAAMRGVFEVCGRDRVSSAEACEQLNASEDAPWGAFRDGRGIDARALARLLGEFTIRPGSVRLQDGSTPKGYRRDQFTEAWARYVSPALVEEGMNATPPHAAADEAPGRGAPVTRGGRGGATSEPRRQETSVHGACGGVAAEDPSGSDAGDWRADLADTSVDPDDPFDPRANGGSSPPSRHRLGEAVSPGPSVLDGQRS